MPKVSNSSSSCCQDQTLATADLKQAPASVFKQATPGDVRVPAIRPPAHVQAPGFLPAERIFEIPLVIALIGLGRVGVTGGHVCPSSWLQLSPVCRRVLPTESGLIVGGSSFVPMRVVIS